jgi:multidrug efflux system membrane fusion protein
MLHPTLRLAVLGSMFFAAACAASVASERPAVPVRVAEALARDAGDGVRYSAGLKPNEQAVMSFRVAGYVRSVRRVRGVDGRKRFIGEGDFVRKGALLAQLRDAEYRVKVSQARSRLREAEAHEKRARAAIMQAESAPDTARSRLDEAQAALDKARLDHERVERLVRSRTLAQADLDATRTRLAMARATTQGAKVGVGVAPATIESARAQLDLAHAAVAGAAALLREAEIALGDTALRAPFDAVILRRNVELGALAGPGAPAFVLADVRQLKAVFGVPDTRVERMALGQPVELVLAARPGERLAARISRISAAADPQSRAFEVEVALDNADGRLKAGMIATLIVGAPKRASILTVPLSAVLRPRGKSSGYAVLTVEKRDRGHVTSERLVELGRVIGNDVEVLRGLTVGAPIVVAGATFTRAGDPVRVVP